MRGGHRSGAGLASALRTARAALGQGLRDLLAGPIEASVELGKLRLDGAARMSKRVVQRSAFWHLGLVQLDERAVEPRTEIVDRLVDAFVQLRRGCGALLPERLSLGRRLLTDGGELCPLVVAEATSASGRASSWCR
jgi:hypothetical protein